MGLAPSDVPAGLGTVAPTSSRGAPPWGAAGKTGRPKPPCQAPGLSPAAPSWSPAPAPWLCPSSPPGVRVSPRAVAVIPPRLPAPPPAFPSRVAPFPLCHRPAAPQGEGAGAGKAARLPSSAGRVTEISPTRLFKGRSTPLGGRQLWGGGRARPGSLLRALAEPLVGSKPRWSRGHPEAEVRGGCARWLFRDDFGMLCCAPSGRN